MTSPGLLEEVLRRDRRVVTIVLVTVISGSWLYLLAGAGTGMRPLEMAAIVPQQAGTAGMLLSPAAWTPGYAFVMLSMWWQFWHSSESFSFISVHTRSAIA